MQHRLVFSVSDNNATHVVRCTCGWAHANTRKATHERGLAHQNMNSPYAWKDRGRLYEPDRLVATPAWWEARCPS